MAFWDAIAKATSLQLLHTILTFVARGVMAKLPRRNKRSCITDLLAIILPSINH